MTHPRRPRLRVLAASAAALVLVLAPALPAAAAPVVEEVPGGLLASSIVEYEGLLYLGSDSGLRSFDGTTFTPVPGSPDHARDFVEYLGDLWMIGGDPTAGQASLWRFDGAAITQVEPFALNPVVIGGLLYLELGDALGDWVVASHDGVTTTPAPGSPTDVSSLVAGPNGEIVYTSGSPRKLWTFDGVATHAEVPHAGAPVDVRDPVNLPGALAFSAEENPGDDLAAYTWDGSAFTKLGVSGGGAIEPGCFVEEAGTLYYAADDGTARMFSATPGLAGSETAVTPTIPSGCPRYVATDGTFYLQALGAAGADPTLHTWDGATLVQLDAVGAFPKDFVEYGGKLYFIAQPVSETPALFVLEDVATTPTAPVAPTPPTLPPTGDEVSPLAIGLGALLVVGGAGILLVVARRRRA